MAPLSPDRADAVVHVDRLSRRFGAKLALDDLSLVVPRGTVFGIVTDGGSTLAGVTKDDAIKAVTVVSKRDHPYEPTPLKK